MAVAFAEFAEKAKPARGNAVLRDQLERASTAIPFNIAEGACKLSFADKRRFYDIARGSAGECAAIIENMFLRQVISKADYVHGRRLLLRLVQMLTKLSASSRWKDRT